MCRKSGVADEVFFYFSRRIGEHLEEVLPALDSVILTNNSIQELGDIDNLSTVKTLTTVW